VSDNRICRKVSIVFGCKPSALFTQVNWEFSGVVTQQSRVKNGALPSHRCLVCSIIDNLNVDAKSGQVGGQHQAGGTCADNAYLAF
jgi:hypothetical protein